MTGSVGAFSADVDCGSRDESAVKQKLRAPIRCDRIGKGSSHRCARSEALQNHGATARLATAGPVCRGAIGRAILAVVIAALWIVMGPAAAGPRSINDCESIKDANAYNLCLASFGPMRGQHGATYPGVANEGGKRDAIGQTGKGATPRHAGAYQSHGSRVTRSGNGRVRMEFTPGR